MIQSDIVPASGNSYVCEFQYRMDNIKMFDVSGISDKALLIYDAQKSLMPARELGEAILGMESCLKIAGRISLLNFDDIQIEPIESGSIKTVFRYVKKNPVIIISGLDLIANLMNNSMDIIGKFGIDNVKTSKPEIIQQVTDERILRMCQNAEFRQGLEKIAKPINEDNKAASVIIGGISYQISPDNKYQFIIGPEKEKILPELINGDTVNIVGEITRINKTTNDLGFRYHNRILSVVPIDDNESTVIFHQYLAMNEVRLTGVVVRLTDYELPRIKVIRIDDNKPEQQSLFAK